MLSAQVTSPVVKAKVPFEFTVMGRTMPAGDYVIDPANNASTVILKCREHSASIIVPTDTLQSVGPQDVGKLIFHRYGSQYFLSEVWGSGSQGRKLRQTKLERDLALRTAPASTVVAASR
jgi:hypothetical protein